ncbi:MAG: glycosyl hydrolase family 5 [Candidatus Competibacteraceae bacterium]|nr:MAG: glycosyl hydrolase family 5 [Candidatus Competibacteraceae bacterium]
MIKTRCWIFPFIGILLTGIVRAEDSGLITVDLSSGHAANTFLPNQAFGAGLDGLEKGDVTRLYTADNIRQMKSAGFKPISYRLRTELGIEVWHWNEKGVWSNPKRQEGYWVSNDHSAQPIMVTHGYRLPRRGNTFDQAGNNGYSRLDDNDPKTFWKSNPYLDQHYTGEDNALHPQWVVIDFGQRIDVNAARILWGTPYATFYQFEYWDGVDPIYLNENPPDSRWRLFQNGDMVDKAKTNEVLLLSQEFISARYVRILLTKASAKAPIKSRDIRDGLGYAIRELYFGTLDDKGRFHDEIRHGKHKDKQTIIYTSSTDPWHRVSDKDPNVEQPGFDLIMRSGLSNHLPILTPVGLLYDTPENSAAEIRFLKSRGYPVTQIEMGEEPDGQYITPEDYGALYRQWAKIIHKINPRLKLGGPGFQTDIDGWHAWPDAQGNSSWMNRFLNDLRIHHRLEDFNFFSFEWYPFDGICDPAAPQLAKAPELLDKVMQSLRQDGVPANIPWIITEYGYSAFAGRTEVEIPSALLNAEIVGQFLSLGGHTAYLYGYQPNTPILEPETCDQWGNLMLFLADDKGRIRAPMPTYYGAKLLTQAWAQPVNRLHRLYPASSNLKNDQGQPLVTAYAVYRPDHQWALMLINKSPQQAQSVTIRFLQSSDKEIAFLKGKLDIFQYSPKQYAWHSQGEQGYPTRSNPPEHFTIQSAAASTPITLPAYSLTIVRGQGPVPGDSIHPDPAP